MTLAPHRQLTNRSLEECVGHLCRMDQDLAKAVATYGNPPLWGRRPGYATLVRIILEQQVSLASARAVFKRLRQATGDVTPEQVVSLRKRGLRQCGFTRQKAEYCFGIARLIVNQEFDLHGISRWDDQTAHNELTAIKGVGPWTADCYLMMALRRPDIWPDGDVALAESARRVKRLRARPQYDRLNRMAARWRPYRSVAARILWHAYLEQAKQKRLSSRE